MYSKIHSRLDWFFGYIGEPEPEDEILLGDLNFDEILNISDIILVINMILNPNDIYIPEMFTAADMDGDGNINVVDVVQLVSEILGTSFRGAIEWLKVNYPELDVERRLQDLDFIERTDEFEYSLEDFNSTSPTYGLDVWNPEYSGFITMHYFSSQG